MKRKVDLSNAMVIAAFMIIWAIIAAGGSGTIEHPADPATDPFPSIFNLDIAKKMCRELGASIWHFVQCMWGCPGRKETMMIGVADAVEMQKFVDRKCCHKTHAKLHGYDEQGRFRTRITQAYPQPMCEQLAKAHMKHMMEKGPAAGDAELSSQVLLDAIDQLREERKRALAQHAPLPASFLEASG